MSLNKLHILSNVYESWPRSFVSDWRKSVVMSKTVCSYWVFVSLFRRLFLLFDEFVKFLAIFSWGRGYEDYIFILSQLNCNMHFMKTVNSRAFVKCRILSTQNHFMFLDFFSFLFPFISFFWFKVVVMTALTMKLSCA